MKKADCNVAVTWLSGSGKTESCTLKTSQFNHANWLVFVRSNDHDFTIDIASVRSLSLYPENPRFLRISTDNSRMLIAFADSRQAAAWLKRIKDLGAGSTSIAAKQNAQNSPANKTTPAKTSGDGMEIPHALRPSVKFALTETALFGPIGAFSSVADISAIAGMWGYLLVQYAKHYRVALDKESAVKICSTALLGMGGYYVGCKAATRLFHLIPGAGTLAAMGVSSLQNIIFTYRFAVTLTRIFNKGTVDFNALAESIKVMFAGTGNTLGSIKNIVNLYWNY